MTPDATPAAGPALDAEIGKLMGLTPGVDFGEWPDHQWKLGEDGEVDMLAFDSGNCNGPVCVRCGYSYCEHGPREPNGPCAIDPPQYSTSIAAAWQVVEQAIDYYVAATTDMDHQTGRPTRHRWELWFGERGAAQHGVGFGETAPLAICLAALRALGREDS